MGLHSPQARGIHSSHNAYFAYYAKICEEGMPLTVSASEVQRQFGRVHDAAMKSPVEIQNHGRTTAYLVSAETFEQMWASYRRAFFVGDLTDEEMRLISEAKVPEDLDWDPEKEARPNTTIAP